MNSPYMHDVQDPMNQGMPLITKELPPRKPFRIWAGVNLGMLVLGWVGIVLYLRKLGEETTAANAEYNLAGEATFVLYFFAMFLALWFLIFFIWDLVMLLKRVGKPRAWWVSMIVITVLGVIPAFLSILIGVLGLF